MTYASELPRSTPEAQGIAASGIQAFIDFLEQKRLGVHSFVLVRNGHVVADGWWNPYASHLPHSMFSVSKSFTSTAIGLAISEGRLSLDDPILSFFPTYITPEISENMGPVQIRHLLSMSTGHAEDTIGAVSGSPKQDWVGTFLSIPITHEPGTHFIYNSGATFMLSAILQSLTGQTLVEYLNPRLFQPLDIAKPFWQANKSGITVGASGLSIKTADLAKFGQLYLQRGMWHGQRLVPEAWIEQATSVQISNGDAPDSDWSQGYGFQFWRSRHDAYRADGAFGQFCLVMPAYNAVLAATSGTKDMQGILNAIWDHLLPAMHPEPLQESSQTIHALKERLVHLALPLPETLSTAPAIAARIAQRTIQLEANSLHIKEVAFTFEPDASTCTIRDDKDAQQVIRCGRSGWLPGESALWRPEGPPVPQRVVAHGGWTDEHTFVMTWQYIETPFSHIITFDFHPDEVGVSIRLDLPFWVERNEQVQGHLV